MATEAIWVNGQAAIPQERPATTVELVWVDGQSGALPFGQYTGGGGFKAYWLQRQATILGGGLQ